MGRHGENIHKRKDGRWEARIILKRSTDGRTKYKYIYGKSYADVKKRKNLLLEQMDAIQNFDDSQKMNLEQLIYSWLAFMQDNIKESTRAKYIFLIEKHICPEIGHITLENLTTQMIDNFTKEKLRNGRLDNEKGLSPKTVSSILSIIKSSVNYGRERLEGCPLNVSVHYPRQILPETQILTIREQKTLENYICQNTNYVHIGIMLTLYTGMRIGEICALRWGDINLADGTVSISRTILRIQNTSDSSANKTKIVVGRPKTDCSNRTIPLPAFLIDYLSEFRESDERYILTGAPVYLEPRGYYAKYKRVMKKNGLEKYTYHALRHTFATRCVENGFDIKSLSEILGHSDVATTLQRYVHPSMSLKKQHMDKLQSISIYGQNTGQRIS